jgi:alanine racemase
VLGAINLEQIEDFIHNDIEITTSSIEKSQAISRIASEQGKTAKVHIKIDTGMERIGVHWYHAVDFIESTFALPNLEVKGVFSHLAKAESDAACTNTQLSRFDEVVSYMQKKNILPPLVHLANSAAVINHKDTHFNLVRPGIMVYGYNPNGYLPDITFDDRKLKPVMTLKTKVSYFKVCPAKTGISYNHTYTTTAQTRVVTLPVGYGDGYTRLLSNKAEVVIRGKKYRVAGNICMDQTMVDIGPDGTAYNGDDVLLFGNMDDHEISLETLCDQIGTITYELLCNVSSRVPRIYLD